jgi:hypothetical protein
MMVSTAATMKACSVAVRVSSGSASGAAVGVAGWASAGTDRTVVSAAAVPTAPLRKSRRGMVSSAMKLLPRAVTGFDPRLLDERLRG